MIGVLPGRLLLPQQPQNLRTPSFLPLNHLAALPPHDRPMPMTSLPSSWILTNSTPSSNRPLQTLLQQELLNNLCLRPVSSTCAEPTLTPSLPASSLTSDISPSATVSPGEDAELHHLGVPLTALLEKAFGNMHGKILGPGLKWQSVVMTRLGGAHVPNQCLLAKCVYQSSV